MPKPDLSLDFDGVLHSYTSGWKGPTIIPDPPVPGAIEFIVRASERFTVNIFSSRSGHPGGIEAMQRWLWEWGTEREPEGLDLQVVIGVLNNVRWPTQKPPAMLSIDDRAITFNGDWSSYDVMELASFQPWPKWPKEERITPHNAPLPGEPMQQRPRRGPIRF